jgi:Choline dehydrogenase and related flavoproteins
LKKACSYLNINSSFREKIINQNLKLIEFENSEINFGETYKQTIKKSKYISLILNLQFTNFIGDGSTVREIECMTKTLEKIKIKSDIFILACGGIENSRLLLWSKEISNLNLNYLPIGNYWMEHPFIKKLANVRSQNNKLLRLLNNNYESHSGFLQWGNKTFSLAPKKNFIKKNKILNAGLFITIHKRDNYYPKDILKNIICSSHKFSKLFEKITKKEFLCGATISASWEQEPLFENRISLDSIKDKFGIPKTILYYKKTSITKKLF